jgi:hypothetical protein
MRLPNLSPSIDRRIPGSAPASLARGAVQPHQVKTCEGSCSSTNPCTNPDKCECNSNGECVPQGGGGGSVRLLRH